MGNKTVINWHALQKLNQNVDLITFWFFGNFVISNLIKKFLMTSLTHCILMIVNNKKRKQWPFQITSIILRCTT